MRSSLLAFSWKGVAGDTGTVRSSRKGLNSSRSFGQLLVPSRAPLLCFNAEPGRPGWLNPDRCSCNRGVAQVATKGYQQVAPARRGCARPFGISNFLRLYPTPTPPCGSGTGCGPQTLASGRRLVIYYSSLLLLYDFGLYLIHSYIHSTDIY